MTVTTTHAYVAYAGNSSTTAFSVTFQFFTSAELVVTAVSSAGVETVKALTTHYTVSGGQTSEGLPSTGTVTMLTAPATGTTLRIERATRLTQSRSHSNNDAFPAKTVEGAYDWRALVEQDLDLKFSRSFKVSIQDYIDNGEPELPSSSPGEVLGWDNSGNITNIAVDAIGSTLFANPLVYTAMTKDSDAASGWFADYDCFAALKIGLTQSEDQTGVNLGGLRDLVYFEHIDNDVNNYESLADQKVSLAARAFTTGKKTAGVFQAQYKDLVGGWFMAQGCIEWADRGVSGILADAIQYGEGIASNELWVNQPSTATTQSLSMAAVQPVTSAKYLANDGTHKYYNVLATNVGKRVTAAFAALSAGTGGDDGQFQYGIDMSGATIDAAGAAIVMPDSETNDEGTTIEYDANDYTNFVRATNTYNWVVGGAVVFSVNASGASFTFGDGSAALPPFHGTETDNGMFFGTNLVGFATAGTERMRLDANGVLIISHTASIETKLATAAVAPIAQIIGADGPTSSELLARFSADASGPTIHFGKSRHATRGSHTVVQSGDTLGMLSFAGSDGTDMAEGARISAVVDATPGAGDMPTAIVVATSADGAESPTERARIDSAGRLLLGHPSALATILATSAITPSDQTIGATAAAAAGYRAQFSADAVGPTQYFGKSRHATAGSHTVVQSADVLGRLSFAGSDGTDMAEAARITVEVDGTPGAGDMPGRIVFATSADGAESPTEHLRLNQRGDLGLGETGGPFSGVTAGRRYFSVKGASAAGVMQLSSAGADADLLNLGIVEWHDSTNDFRAAYIATLLRGATGNNRGAGMSFGVKVNGASTINETMLLDEKTNICLGVQAAIATNATDGFVYVPTCAGTPTGAPTAFTGLAPIVINTTNNKLYFYSGGAWRDAGP